MTKRLTQRNKFGNAEIIALSDSSMSDLYGALLTYKERDALENALNKLADYEDKEEENGEEVPTINMREVVYCKDCKYSYPINCVGIACSKHNGCLKYPYDFCNYGVKFDEE